MSGLKPEEIDYNAAVAEADAAGFDWQSLLSSTQEEGFRQLSAPQQKHITNLLQVKMSQMQGVQTDPNAKSGELGALRQLGALLSKIMTYAGEPMMAAGGSTLQDMAAQNYEDKRRAALTDLVSKGMSQEEAQIRNREQVAQAARNVARQTAHYFTGGLVDAPEQSADPFVQQTMDQVVKPATGLVAIGGQLLTGSALLGLVTKVPLVAARVSNLSATTRALVTGGILDFGINAAWPEGMPKEDRFGISDDIARTLAPESVEESPTGFLARMAMGAGGAVEGGLLAGLLFGVGKGAQLADAKYAFSIDQKTLDGMSEMLRNAGHDVDAMTKGDVWRTFRNSLSDLELNADQAVFVGERLTAEAWATSTFVEDAVNTQLTPTEGRVLWGIFSNNRGGISLAKGVDDAESALSKLRASGLEFDATVVERTIKPGKKAKVRKAPVPGEEPVSASVASSAEPVVPQGHVRFYSGGAKSGTPTWFSPDKAYAEGYAKKSGQNSHVSYVDLPEDHPLLTHMSDVSGTNLKPTYNSFQATPEVTAQARPLPQATAAVEAAEPTKLFDVIVSRPKVVYGAAAKLPKNVLQRAKQFETLATSGRRTITEAQKAEQFLMPHGQTVVGSIPSDVLATKMKVPPVVVNGVDETSKTIKESMGAIRMDWSTPGTLKLELPHRITDEQVTKLSRFFDNNQIETVAITNAKGEVTSLVKPIGAQVEDVLYNTTGKYATKSSRLTPELISQYKKTGVFQGQAAVLSDGTPVEVRTKSGFTYTIFDPTTRKELKVHQSKISVLPTTLEDQLAPNNVFAQYLAPDDMQGIAKLRRGLEAGLGQPIKKFHQLETLAASKGLLAEKLTRGKVALRDLASGERLQYTNLEAAVEGARNINRPAPDLTPQELKDLFGGQDNIGFVGLNGSPPDFGGQIPVPTNIVFENHIENSKLPGAASGILKPMRALFQDIEQSTKVPTGTAFLNLQEATVHRQNFNARWVAGKGRPLDNGVMPLDKIRKMAGGRKANEEIVTQWLESGADPELRRTIEAQMTPAELKAAPELRKWYDALFNELGVEADYLENYAPHWRANAGKYGNDIYEIWRATRGNTPLPKGAAFFADYYRTGMDDLYDTAAFRVAARYAFAGSSNRFMKEPLDFARKLVNGVPDRAITKPMSEYLEALAGFEFVEQKQAINRTLNATFNKLPGLGGQTAVDLADKLSDMAIGLGYMSSLAFRFPSVLRNYTQIFHTTYAIFGHANGAFAEGIGRAATKAGKLAAVEDGVISYKSASVFGRQEIDDLAPSAFKKFSDAGFKLYDSADEFTRATSYWVARENASRSIAKFARTANGANPARSQRAVDQLLLDAKAYMFEDNIQKEFLRRVVTNPESAARFLGKQAADVTQFLYGRGMQPYWMRSVWGKFFGQYGTWSLWYIDYLTRTTKNLMRAGQKGEAVKFLGRNVAVNMAFLYAGHEVLEVDLSKWMSYPAVFYSGGPGTDVAIGMKEVFRGLADVTAGSESPFAQSHLTKGIQTLGRAGLSYIPFRSAARDVQRIVQAGDSGDGTDLLAALLGTKATKDHTIQAQLDALFPGGPLAHEEWLRYDPTATPGPSASAQSEMELYRQMLVPASVPGENVQVPGVYAPASVGTGGIPREAMGLTPPPGRSTSQSLTTSQRQSGVVLPPTTETKPLQR